MIKTDYHMHTCYSFDSNEKMEDIVKQSIEIGLTEIVFTDHLETIEPGTGIDSIIDYDEYIREIEDLRHRYGKDINIMLGAEINLEPSIEKETNEYLSRYPFDFIIGSLHASDFTDFAMSDISRGLTQDEYYSKYFEWGMDCVKRDFNFSVLGHLDYIVRYGGYDNKFLNMDVHRESIREILKTLIERGKGIEINTAGLRYNLGHVHPKMEILHMYKELGGEIITAGSVAHKKSDLARDFDIAYEILKECGFNYYTRFEKLSPLFERIY